MSHSDERYHLGCTAPPGPRGDGMLGSGTGICLPPCQKTEEEVNDWGRRPKQLGALARTFLESSICFTGKGCRGFPANPRGPDGSRDFGAPLVKNGLEANRFRPEAQTILSKAARPAPYFFKDAFPINFLNEMILGDVQPCFPHP
jgi:hypothetical protein